MWPFRKGGDGEVAESRYASLSYALQTSFQRVKGDMDNLSSWLSYLYSQDSHKQALIDDLRSKVSQMSSNIRSIHASGESHSHPEINELQGVVARLKKAEDRIEQLNVSSHSVQPLIGRIAEINSKVSLLDQNQKGIFERLKDISSRVEKAELSRTRTGLNLREKIVRNVAKHSKDYIKNLILSTIAKYDQMHALQLREMIVEEQGLCSKSTFYRLLEEIEQEEEVGMISRGKEKIYIPKVVKKH